MLRQIIKELKRYRPAPPSSASSRRFVSGVFGALAMGNCVVSWGIWYMSSTREERKKQRKNEAAWRTLKWQLYV